MLFGLFEVCCLFVRTRIEVKLLNSLLWKLLLYLLSVTTIPVFSRNDNSLVGEALCPFFPCVPSSTNTYSLLSDFPNRSPIPSFNLCWSFSKLKYFRKNSSEKIELAFSNATQTHSVNQLLWLHATCVWEDRSGCRPPLYLLRIYLWYVTLPFVWLSLVFSCCDCTRLLMMRIGQLIKIYFVI